MEGVWRITTPTGTFFARPSRDRAILELAEAQHRVVSVDQFAEAGLGSSGVRRRLSAGTLQRVHSGVYALGPGPLGQKGQWLAAILAVGNGAVLSHRSAAALWGLRADHRDRTDVSSASPSGRSRPGMTIHRSATLASQDITAREGIPCTSLARTLLDCAEGLNQRELDRMVEQAEVLRLFGLKGIEDVLDRANGRRGATQLRRAVAAAVRPALTESELEERMLHFLRLCATAGIPELEVNVWLAVDGGHVRPDFLWREQGLVVETDGGAFHDNPFASERDHEKDLRLRLAGWRVLRFTWRQVTGTPDRVMRAVAAELGSGP